MSEIPESTEALIEGMRRDAAGLTDYHLDLALAIAQARRDVAAAHQLSDTADVWQQALVAYDGVRRARRQTRREIDDLTGPQIITRQLTAEELAGSDWGEDEPSEPPC